MSRHDFGNLVAHYPAVIEQMPPVFKAHEFILRLAHQQQRLYVEALYAYKDRPPQGAPTPFLIVHRMLAQRLSDFPHLIRQVGTEIGSEDIFGNQSQCSQWRRI